jgi:uncharacterized membrane protein YcjF (UPF0283 family)
MGSRGSRRRARATILAVAYGLLVTVCVGVSIALFAQSQWVLRVAAAVAALGAVAATLLVRHQLIVERSVHGEDRAQLSQDYSRLTNARVVENAEFVDTMHRRLDKIDEEVATVVNAGDKHSEADAPTVVDLKLRGLAAS